MASKKAIMAAVCGAGVAGTVLAASGGENREGLQIAGPTGAAGAVAMAAVGGGLMLSSRRSRWSMFLPSRLKNVPKERVTSAYSYPNGDEI